VSQRCFLYRITAENLALRRAFIGLDDETTAVLAAARPWAEAAAGPIAAALAEHHFGFEPTRRFFAEHAAKKGVELTWLRDHWQGAHVAHFRAIFTEASSRDPFGLDYFELLLGVGALHNQIDLPLKWYLGSYPTLMEAVRHRLREQPPRDVDPHALERALSLVFNYDMQAITDAFYFDTFATMGLDLEAIAPGPAAHDLSDRGAELKTAVSESLQLLIESSSTVHNVLQHTRAGVDRTTQALTDIAGAAGQVSGGAERQVEMLGHSTRLAEDAATATATARTLSADGADASRRANELIQRVRSAALDARTGIDELERKSREIGGILDAITAIADQTNLLALNAAIEAARAGEHGRGFAVVAEEVRKLAEQSGSSATSIAALVADIQRETSEVVRLVQDAADLTEQGAETSDHAHARFGEITSAIASIAERVEGMTAAAAEILSVAETSSATAQEMSSATQQTTVVAGEISASVSDLAESSERLLSAASRFTLGRSVGDPRA